MIALETAVTPESIELEEAKLLVGFNLTMAREDMFAAIIYGSDAPQEPTQVLTNFVGAMHEALFGEFPLAEAETVEDVTELLRRQLGCLASQELVEFEVIKDRVEDYALTQPLPMAVEYTIEDILGPLLWQRSEKT